MKILANKKIKELFGKITVCTVIFILAAVLLTSFEAESVTLVIILCMVGMGAVILIFGYGYFKEQNEVMETAVSQIKEYISGNHEARIDCDEEGEVYRLFHEVNSLVTILKDAVGCIKYLQWTSAGGSSGCARNSGIYLAIRKRT